jgi:processive 1,2-diacylglycerol beta-glucosyltransferase
MIKLFDNEREVEVGEITEPQLEFLVEELVEESLDEYTWNLTAAALESLQSAGADPELLAVLRRALGSRTSIELRYEPD